VVSNLLRIGFSGIGIFLNINILAQENKERKKLWQFHKKQAKVFISEQVGNVNAECNVHIMQGKGALII
jgi:hypothetical protein